MLKTSSKISKNNFIVILNNLQELKYTCIVILQIFSQTHEGYGKYFYSYTEVRTYGQVLDFLFLFMILKFS